MNISKINNIGAIESFLEGNQAIAFAVLGDKHERYKRVPVYRRRYNWPKRISRTTDHSS